MNVFKKLRGTIETFFQLGISATSHGIADNANGVEARTNNNAAASHFISGVQATADDQCPNRLDLKQRDCLIAQGFDGVTGPVGATVGDYMICHTSGGGYTAGQIYIATAPTVGVAIPMYKMQNVCNLNAFSGTVGMIANGFYTATTGAAPFGWTLFGDGTAGAAGEVRIIVVPYDWTDFIIGSTTLTSTTAISNNAGVSRTTVVVKNAFAPVAALATIAVDVLGVPTPLMLTTDSNLYLANTQFQSDEQIPISTGGFVQLTLAAAIAVTAGSGNVVVEYCNVPLP